MKLVEWDNGDVTHFILKDVEDPVLIEAFETYAPIDHDRFRIIKRKPWGIDVLFFWDFREVKPMLEFFSERFAWDKDSLYGKAECPSCGRTIYPADSAWQIDGKPYCVHCAADMYRHVAEDETECSKCGRIIEPGEDVWMIPGEEQLCETCATRGYYRPLCLHWLFET